ncbi:hypothetical protein CSC70_01925 [Pseudoxanthomonas kalamensis DSM 18571]|uniref:MlaA family lipoprotein n=1 Tax=Pseudoxanthomonas kalamensis TaxID=289483 RepID=UPI001391F163|nr:VacJ family lipoprotein [Pseudoxanthomonas kalamensis]KAF1712306.1 hypothetical protein CSC70_01925 [Pseudoxanthomonas kalamensis DSM 18571]
MTLRFLLMPALALLLGACATAPKGASDAGAPAAIVRATDTTPVAVTDPAETMPTTDAPVEVDSVEPSPAGDPATDTATTAEDDYAAIYGDAYDPVADPNLPPGVQPAASYDPWEGYNRKMHAFNNAVDRAVAKPLARGYQKVVPRPVRLGISNFFDNLGQPITALNSLLQGKFKQAGQAMGRFLMNSTLGIGGIFDPASDANLPRNSEDFGQTLGVWGWKRSRYFELPLFGPRTIRDTVGLAGDAPLAPIRQLDDTQTQILLQGVNLVDIRAQLLSLDPMRDEAVDEYALVRDSWLQRRNYQINEGRGQARDEGLPDYLYEEEDHPTVPVDAMPPIPIPGAGNN